MIDILCVVDDNNPLQSFFIKEKDYLNNLLQTQIANINFNVVYAKDITCEDDFNNFRLKLDSSAIIAAYTHGNYDAFRINNINYIDKCNSELMKDTMVYSTSCNTAKGIGRQLKQDGCQAFVGYNDISFVSGFCEEYKEEMFMQCDHACIASFLTNEGKHITEAFQDAISYFDAKIKFANDMGDPILGGILARNKMALTMLYNKDITKADLCHA